jgi:hypothetical protein
MTKTYTEATAAHQARPSEVAERQGAVSERALAERFGIGKDTGTRIWKNHNLKPWKVEAFKISTDPNFEEKLVVVVCLYLHPPERAIVPSFDEKTHVPASIAPSRPSP